jgi:hypothetical protein
MAENDLSRHAKIVQQSMRNMPRTGSDQDGVTTHDILKHAQQFHTIPTWGSSSNITGVQDLLDASIIEDIGSEDEMRLRFKETDTSQEPS